jgi:uncharacterized protein (TIGR03085 family)
MRKRSDRTAGRTSDGTAERDFTAASRDALVEALLAAGPGQPTLCEGWQTQHLAAHIVLRESSPLVVGLVLRPFAQLLDRRTMALGESAASPEAYQEIVDRIAAGPRATARLRRHARTAWLTDDIEESKLARRAAQATNLLEFFVHTEDIRRAQDRWAPRHLADAYADALFSEFTRQARLLYRREPAGVVLARSTGQRVVAKAADEGGQSRTVSGPAGELVMHGFGRRDNALVVVD